MTWAAGGLQTPVSSCSCTFSRGNTCEMHLIPTQEPIADHVVACSMSRRYGLGGRPVDVHGWQTPSLMRGGEGRVRWLTGGCPSGMFVARWRGDDVSIERRGRRLESVDAKGKRQDRDCLLCCHNCLSCTLIRQILVGRDSGQGTTVACLGEKTA